MDNGNQNVSEPISPPDVAEQIREDDADTATLPEAHSEDRSEFPCSVAQERFWLLDRLEPGNSSLNVAVRWRLEGQISTQLLERAWLKIIDRHEVLRSVFLEIDGVPMQRAMPRSQFKLAEIDLSNLSDDARQIEGDRIGVIEARSPFDLVAGPLIRATLLRYSPTVSVILVTTHQIVSDGWSIGVMAREMGNIYQSLRNEEPITLDELPLQYADYSMWQLEWLRARGTDAETAYWTRQLAGVKPFQVLPDRPRPAVPTTNGAIASIVLPRELTNRAQVLSGDHGATLFATALSALTATLSRYTGEDEIVVGTQVSDRDQVELEGMIGQFVNSLILRNDLSGDPRFSELIGRARETIGQALEYRHIPIERLLSMVKAERRSAQAALISVNFIFQRTFIQNEDYGDFKLIDMPSLPAGAIYDLNFFMVERPDGWRFSCQYNTDQFESETAYRLLNYVRKAMESAVDNSELRVSQLGLIAADERSYLLTAFNDTQADYPHDTTLPRLFEKQVSRTPDALALVCDDRQLSYRQLDLEANRLAAYLLSRGVECGARIGICLDRSAELLIAILATSKAGAAYVPLDPSDPPARLAQLIDTAQLHHVITRASFKNALRGVQVSWIDLDAARVLISQAADTPPPVRIVPDSEAYLVFTASPLGDVNGVRISHRALLARLWALRERPGLSARDVVVAVTPSTLDLAAFELLLPLLVGARVVVATAKDLSDDYRLLQLLRRSDATLLHATPSVWSGLIAAEWDGQPRLRIVCCGETPDRRLVSQLLDRGDEVWRLYGCPEATICAAAHRFLPQDDTLPIGAPLANTRLYVLNASGDLMPTGAPGELCIGGEGLALGGLGTSLQHSFVNDPFSGAAGSRLCRTGDIVRIKNNGHIEYLSRADQRIRLNGYLIEPAEIEAALRRHPDIADAAVVTAQNRPGLAAITACVVPRSTMSDAQSEGFIAALRGSLAQSLPVHMIPAAFLLLGALPRLPDGAIDRQALRNPATTSRKAGKVAERPANDIERGLLRIWRAMLGREDIDLVTNFFELGGHSLLAARMLGRVEAEFGRRISLAALFRAPSIQELARLLEDNEARDFDFRQVVKLQPVGTQTPLIGINNTGIYYILAKRLGADQPFTSLQLFDPAVRSDTLPKTLEAIAAAYVELIRRVQPVGPYALMGWCVAGALAFEIARQLNETGQEVSALYLMDSWVPGYLRRLPPFRKLINDYTLRWQFVLADWRSKRSHNQGFWAFVENRMFAKRLQQIFDKQDTTSRSPQDAATRQATPEDYDQWLLGYLQDVTSRYEPKRYRGKITLFRSHREPTGWWFDPNAGWGEFADGGVNLHLVDGDHFTMFQEPGVSQIAEKINASIEIGSR